MTYEAAQYYRAYLQVLGASARVVTTVAGFGELVGYALRLVSGYIADRTSRYWTVTIIGYVVNMVAVPVLALTGQWEVAACFIVAERVGKAIRTPTRDAMLSHATTQMGRGWGFGLHEALDQLGAMLEPLIIVTVLHFRVSYQNEFALLAIPAALTLSVLIAARILYPRPRDLEANVAHLETKGLATPFWLYLGGTCLVAAGYADFPLIAYHFKYTSTVSDMWIPVFYSIAMEVDALAALLFGRLFDRLGLRI